MKILISTLLIITITTISHAQTKDAQDFSWLLGDWQRTNNQVDEITTETWEISGQEYHGLGITLEGSDTVFFEHMTLKNIEDQMHLVVSTPEHNVAVEFKITSNDNKSFIAENPDNDFPKKIIYNKTNEGLLATISSGDKKIEFVFERISD